MMKYLLKSCIDWKVKSHKLNEKSIGGKKEIQQIENSRAWKLGSKVKSTNVDSDSSSNEEIKNRLATIPMQSIYTLQTEIESASHGRPSSKHVSDDANLDRTNTKGKSD